MSTIDKDGIVDIRRDLHAHPESGWTEFRTTALVAEELNRLGYTLHLGSDAIVVDERLGVPSDDEIAGAVRQARKTDAPTEYLDQLGNVTGLVAEKTYGDGTGAIVGVRVDMDALNRTEASDSGHYPVQEGFASQYPGKMHACGHDGHTAIGIGIARAIEERSEFSGTLRLFFQPAEEGGRGGLPMSKTDHLNDIDYFFALHLGLGNETGTIIAGYDRPLSNVKLEVVFDGESAHAGAAPEAGKNALQAAATAIQNLFAIPRHSDGATRINVGQVASPNDQNVISERAELRVEVRGETADLSESMLTAAKRILAHSAGMHDVDLKTGLYGKTTTFVSDQHAIDITSEAAITVDNVVNIVERKAFSASEDASFLINRVQATGGKGTYIGIGASNVAGHHTAHFDIDERSLQIGVDVLVHAIIGCK